MNTAHESDKLLSNSLRKAIYQDVPFAERTLDLPGRWVVKERHPVPVIEHVLPTQELTDEGEYDVFDFSRALSFMKQGKRVSRKVWDGNVVLHISDDQNGSDIVFTGKFGRFVGEKPTLTSESILADDWTLTDRVTVH